MSDHPINFQFCNVRMGIIYFRALLFTLKRPLYLPHLTWPFIRCRSEQDFRQSIQEWTK